MTSEWDIDQLDLGAYLRRIGYDPDAKPSLAALHRAHIAAIPFENLDIIFGRGVSVELESVEAKLVHGRRGGYCYEHGLLFGAVLERLGYSVQRLLARVGGDRERPRARTHMTLIVGTGTERWLADVGFGSGLLEPLPLDDHGPRRQGGWTYAVAATGPHAWELRELRLGEWVTAYAFDDQRQYPADVVVANHYTSTWPRSPFVTQSVVVRKDEDSIHELIGRTLTVTRPDRSTEVREVGDCELAGTLHDIFGLSLSAGELAQL